MIVDHDGVWETAGAEEDVMSGSLLGAAIFVGVKKSGRPDEKAGGRYNIMLDPETAAETLFSIYSSESDLKDATEGVMRGRTVIAEKNISADEIPAGIGAYAKDLAEQNKDAAGILLKSANGKYDGSFRKVIAALHKREQKVYGSFNATNSEDIEDIAAQINDGGKKKAMLQRFDGAVINMTDAKPVDMAKLLDQLRKSVRSSALLVVIPPDALPEEADALADDLQYARDNGIYLNANLTKVTESEVQQEMRNYDSGRIGAELDLSTVGRDNINKFFGQVLPQLPLQVLIINTDELEAQLPSGILDNAWLKTSAIFKVLSIRRKTQTEIAADQKKLAFALKEKQLLGEQSLLPQYLDTVVQMRAWKEGDAAVAIPEAWREDSAVAYQMRKLEGNPKAQQTLLEGVVARLLLIKEREAGGMERLKDGFADPALETMLAEALLEQELLKRTGMWNVQEAQIQMDENVSAAVAVDNYVRDRYRDMKAGKAQSQTIEELIAVIKLNAEPKVMRLEPVKEMNRAAYDALLSAA
jgi:hypothetical protein